MAPVADSDHVSIRTLVTIWILFFINLFNYIDRYIVAGILNFLIDKDKSGFKSNLSDEQAGFLTTVFIIAYMVLSPIFGYLGDRYKRSILIAIGLVTWAASTFACSLITEYWQLLLFRAFVGIGEASYAALAPPIIADLIPLKQRTFYLSFFFIGTPVGSALGYIIGGGIAENYGWRWAFRVSPPCCLVLAFLTICLVQDPERGGSDGINPDLIQVSHVDMDEPKHPLLQFWIESWQILSIKAYLFATLGFSCLAFVVGALTQWIPVYVVRASKLAGNPYSNESANFVFGIITVCAGLIAIPMGSIISKAIERFTPRCDAFICAAGMLSGSIFLYVAIAVAPHNINIFWVACFCTQLAVLAGWAPNTAIILYTTAPHMRSLASALNILISHLLGDALSPTIQGKLSDSIKKAFHNFDFSISDCVALEYSFFLSCFICVLAGVCYLAAAECIVEARANATEQAVRKASFLVSSLQRSRDNADNSYDASTILRDEYDGPQGSFREPLITAVSPY